MYVCVFVSLIPIFLPRPQLLAMVNGSTTFLNTTVNASTFAYKLTSLTPGHVYSISLAALSKLGEGPSSQPLRLQTDPALLNPLANRHAGSEGVVREAWFIVLVGGSMFLLLLVLVVLLYIRRVHYKASQLPSLNGEYSASVLVSSCKLFGVCWFVYRLKPLPVSCVCLFDAVFDPP